MNKTICRKFRLWRISYGLPYAGTKNTDGKTVGIFGTRNGNRTHNYPLGGGYYIHLTMQAYYIIISQAPGLCKCFFEFYKKYLRLEAGDILFNNYLLSFFSRRNRFQARAVLR